MKILMVTLVAATVLCGEVGAPAKCDGCSGGVTKFWVTWIGKTPPWQGCCDTHDNTYRAGGTSDQRMQADATLFKCVKEKHGRGWAWVLWIGVRIGGTPFMPFDWRWGGDKDYAQSWWYDR